MKKILLAQSLRIALMVFLMFPQIVFAWGGHGHDSICQAATFLVKDKNLQEFLRWKMHVMGYVCNVPDVDWKNQNIAITQSGNAAHYINPEVIGLAAGDVPVDLNQIIEKYTNTESADEHKKILTVPKELGTIWWRADQMVRRGVDYGKKISSTEAPTNSKQEQDNELAYNKDVYEMMISMGLLGHFVGDASMPFHNSSDHDGWAANHGGIHFYYEEASVAQLGPDLMNQIVQKSKKLKNTKFLNGKNPVEKMRGLSVLALGDIQAVLKADPIIKNSVLKLEKGMSLKTPAERQPPSVGAKRFEKLIVEGMARSATLLAAFWDDIYEQSGKPDLKAYRSYRFPYTVEFIQPDYYKVDTDNTKK